MNEEQQKVSCPKCGSDLIQITNGLRRCQQCGYQGQVKDVISAAVEARKGEGIRGWKRADAKT